MRVLDKDELRILMRATKPEEFRDDMSIEQIGEVLQKDGDRIRRLKTFQQAQSTKQSWRKKKNNFMSGIKRFQRNGNVDIRKKVSDKLTNWGRISPFVGDKSSDTQYETFSLKPMLYFDVYEFMADIAALEADVLNIAATYALEEQFIDSSVLADMVVEDLSEFRRLILSGKEVPAPVLETLLILVEKELFGKKKINEGDLVGGYSKLITTK